MRKNNPVFNFRMIIHTVQMVSEIPYIDVGILDIINTKPYIVRCNARPSKKGYLFPINANKLSGFEIDNLSSFLNAMEYIRVDLGLSEWKFNRVDFAFDTKLAYDDIYKYSLYLISLLSEATGIKNAIDIKDVKTKKKRALTIKSPKFEIQIYDKALESFNKHPYCRFEFRFKNICSVDMYILTDRLSKILNTLFDLIGIIEKQRINDLYKLWEKENNVCCTTQIKNFSEFVRRYSNDIFTRDILKGLYQKIYNRNFENWFKKFKRNNQIDFILDSEIKNIAQNMTMALEKYTS